MTSPEAAARNSTTLGSGAAPGGEAEGEQRRARLAKRVGEAASRQPQQQPEADQESGQPDEQQQAQGDDGLAGEQGVTPVPAPHEAAGRGVHPVDEPVDDLDEPDAAARDDQGDGHVHPYGADEQDPEDCCCDAHALMLGPGRPPSALRFRTRPGQQEGRRHFLTAREMNLRRWLR